ncbi:Osmoprotectant-binding protein OsmX [subsurface metagenome]
MKNRKYIVIAVIVLVVCITFVFFITRKPKSIVVASKNFTEQYVLGNLISLLLQENGFQVEEKFGTTSDKTRANIVGGQVDIRPSYTGTVWVEYLKHTEKISDPEELFERVKKEDLEQNNLVWMGRTSFNNTYALAIKKDMVDTIGTTISSLTEYVNKNPEKVIFVINQVFYERKKDGFFEMAKYYNMDILRKYIKVVDTGLTHEAVDKGQADVAMVFGTDAKIKKFDLLVLEDDQHFFSIYNVSIVVRKVILDKYPEIEKILLPITQLLDADTMINLNYEVDVNGKAAKIAAEEFLKKNGLVK